MAAYTISYSLNRGVALDTSAVIIPRTLSAALGKAGFRFPTDTRQGIVIDYGADARTVASVAFVTAGHTLVFTAIT